MWMQRRTRINIVPLLFYAKINWNHIERTRHDFITRTRTRAYVCGWSPIWKYYDSYSRKFTHCHRWAKWYWKIHAIKNVGRDRRTFSWRCVKEERPLDWLLRSIRCYPVFPHRLGRNGASLRRCGSLEETSTKSSWTTRRPRPSKWPRGVRTRLKTIRPATRRIEPKECVWLRVWNSHRASWIPFLSRRLRPTDTSTLWRSTHSFGTSSYFIRKARPTHLRRTDQPLGYRDIDVAWRLLTLFK